MGTPQMNCSFAELAQMKQPESQIETGHLVVSLDRESLAKTRHGLVQSPDRDQTGPQIGIAYSVIFSGFHCTSPKGHAIPPVRCLSVCNDRQQAYCQRGRSTQCHTPGFFPIRPIRSPPHYHDPKTDHREIGVTICMRLLPRLGEANDWNEHSQIPKPTHL